MAAPNQISQTTQKQNTPLTPRSKRTVTLKNLTLTVAEGVFIAALFVAGCGGEPPEETAKPEPAKPAKPPTPELPVPADEALLAGKATFEYACITCHTKGRDEAPVVFDAIAWAPRIAQGADTLYQHAIEGGYFTAEHSEWGMPARGGKDELTDDEVKGAVDYILYVVAQSET